jgi:hypothetical protein
MINAAVNGYRRQILDVNDVVQLARNTMKLEDRA